MDRNDIRFGQRVRYTGDALPRYSGKEGWIEGQSENGFAFVRIPETGRETCTSSMPLVAIMPHNLELVEEAE